MVTQVVKHVSDLTGNQYNNGPQQDQIIDNRSALYGLALGELKSDWTPERTGAPNLYPSCLFPFEKLFKV